MSETFSYKNYSIVASLNERSIYLKVIDTVNFLSYEGNVDLKELRVSIDLDGAYKIIINCFKEESNYSVTISVNSGVLKLAFNALIGGFLKMNFDVLLREKLMSNDGQLTLNFNKLEQKQAQAIDSLTKKCNDLEGVLAKQQQKSEKDIQRLMDIIDKMEVFVAPAHHWSHRNHTQFTANIASTVVTISNADTQMFIERNIAAFYKLQKLTIGNFISVSNFKNMSNDTVTEMELQCVGSGVFTSLEGIQNFPNLEILTIINAPGLKDIVTIMKSTKHKIKTLKFQACTQVNVVELQTYCQVSNVFLAIS